MQAKRSLICPSSRVFMMRLQSNQVKRNPQDNIHELITGTLPEY